MDNRVFNVNGEDNKTLHNAISLAFQQIGQRLTTNYRIDPKKGMLLYYISNTNSIPFPCALDVEFVAPVVSKWLSTEPKIELSATDAYMSGDGDNVLGWRVYYEYEPFLICIIKPAYLWFGK